MTLDSILSSLRAGETSRELSAAICVEAGYVPGEPRAQNVRLGRFGGLLWDENIGDIDELHGSCKAPDLLLDANACMAVERAMFEELEGFHGVETQSDGNWYAWVDLPFVSPGFSAPTELAARVGAVLMARAAREGSGRHE